MLNRHSIGMFINNELDMASHFVRNKFARNLSCSEACYEVEAFFFGISRTLVHIYNFSFVQFEAVPPVTCTIYSTLLATHI
jgi:hypothetical protein